MTHHGIYTDDDWRPKAERVLASVREQLRDTSPHGIPPETALDALRRYLLLCRTPEHREFDPAALVSALASETSTETCVVEVEPTSPCFGDPDQIIEVIRLLRDNASLEKDACLYIEAFEKDHLPQSAISFDGPGHFNRSLSFSGSLGMDLESLERRWTAATRGGRFDKAPNGLILRFKGLREVPPLPVVPPDFDALLQSVVTTLHSEKTQGLARAIDELLLALDTPTSSTQPADLSALIHEVCVQAQPRFRHDGIILRCELSDHVPPIAMRRPRMAVGLQSLMALIDYVLPDGGSVDLTLDYDSDERNAQIMVDIRGRTDRFATAFETASVRRALVEDHGGTLDFDQSDQNILVLMCLPDTIGRTLDAWIPNWDRFSESSQKMLRLLKSPGPTPPESLILTGVLEDELERWLLPRLQEPATVNLAHAMDAQAVSDTPVAAQRLEKVLTQIQKGKARKEAARPPLVGHLLCAFSRDERHRAALGAGALPSEAMFELGSLVTGESENPHRALQLVATVKLTTP